MKKLLALAIIALLAISLVSVPSVYAPPANSKGDPKGPKDLPEVSVAPSKIRVIESENIIAYARPLYTTLDDPSNHEVPTSDPHDGVARLILTRTDGIFGCSGALAIDRLHIITAAHCVTDDNGNYILSSGTATFEGNFESITISIDPVNSLSHPNWDGDYIKGNDIAVLKLPEPAPAQVPGISHATSDISVNKVGDKNGYGDSGFLSSGADSSTYPFGIERYGKNLYDDYADTMYEALGLKPNTDFVPQAIYQYDSDDGNSPHDAFDFFFGNSDLGLGNAEVISAPGDSGGPTILNGELVGVTSYGIVLEFTRGPPPRTSDCTTEGKSPILDSSCGEFAGDTRVSSYSPFIDSVLNSEPNNPPTADANGPYSGTEDSAISFDGTGSSDPDGDALTYSWDFGDGSTGSGATPTHTYSWGDTFTVTLTVSDGKGGSDSDITSAEVTEVNDVPVADANGPYSGTEGVAITFDGSGSSDPDNLDGTTANDQDLTYSWDYGDGTSASGVNLVNPSHSYDVASTYTVTLVVNDGFVDSTSDSTTAKVEPAGGGGSDMYVWETTWSEKHRGRGGQMTDVKVTVDVNHDSDGDGVAESSDNPASTATLTLVLTHDTNGNGIFEPGTDNSWTLGGDTNGEGQITLTLKFAPDGDYQAEVIGLTHATLTWKSNLDGDNPDWYCGVPNGSESKCTA
ncbi:MAG: PKD domain-containing protein [Nitrososphaerales archaeon]